MAFYYGRMPEEEYWLAQARQESQINRQLRHQSGDGPCVIFILDTSASIRGQGFKELKDTFKTIIEEYSRHPDVDENVAVIVCGQTTRFQNYYTNQYDEVIHSLDGVECKGLSPLAAGLLLALGAIQNGASHTRIIYNFHMEPRIVVISDGRPTDMRVKGERDDAELFETEMAKNQVLQVGTKLGHVHPIFCIPVGRNPDMTFLGALSARSIGGKVVYPHEALQFGRYSTYVSVVAFLTRACPDVEHMTREMFQHFLTRRTTITCYDDTDMDQILEIHRRRDAFTDHAFENASHDDSSDEEEYYQELDSNMPPLGTRVKRGPDWIWNNQDAMGPGTVTGHSLSDAGWLHVRWDHGITFHYRYGRGKCKHSFYDVEICDEPRILYTNESIVPGCRVQRGPDWKWENQDGGPGTVGMVYRVTNNTTVYVRWPNTVRSNYRFGYEGKYDVQLCDPFEDGNKSFRPEHTTQACAHRTDARCSENLIRFKKVWMWRDTSGNWNPYSNQDNDTINRNYDRNPQCTVLIKMEGQIYRVVMCKNKQINIQSKEINDVSWRWN